MSADTLLRLKQTAERDLMEALGWWSLDHSQASRDAFRGCAKDYRRITRAYRASVKSVYELAMEMAA
jgi:hypothetical protein